MNIVLRCFLACTCSFCLTAVVTGGEPRDFKTADFAPARDVTTWKDATYYWKDIAGNDFDDEFIKTYDYANAKVVLTYDERCNATFTGKLVATGLKPHFCCQLKFIAGTDSDREAIERIGHAGRWWRAAPEAGNSNDADYREHHGNPEYKFVAYLPFDFFVTDSEGNASVAIRAVNSYHVFWKVSQRTRRKEDGPKWSFTVDGTLVELYGEREPGRARPGKLKLPEGFYKLRMILTEKSFHELDPGWASALMSEPFEFDIRPTCEGEDLLREDDVCP